MSSPGLPAGWTIDAHPTTGALPAGWSLDNQPQPQQGGGGLGDALSHGIVQGATFGQADKLGALLGSGLSHITPGPVVSYKDLLALDQARHAAADNAHPIANLVGEGIGAVESGSALTKGLAAAGAAALPYVARAVPSLPALVTKIGAALMPEMSQVGQQLTGAAKLRNVARLSAQGAAVGAQYGAVSGGLDAAPNGPGTAAAGAATGGLTGALTGGAGGIVGGSLAAAGGAARDYFAEPFQKAAGILAKTLKLSVPEISAAFQNFYNKTGEQLSMTEAAALHSAGDLKQLAADYVGIGSQVQQRAETVAAQLPGKLRGDVDTQLGSPEPQGPMETHRDAKMAAAMAPIRNNPIDLDSDELSFLGGSQVYPVVSKLRANEGEAPQTGDKLDLHLNANSDQQALQHAIASPDASVDQIRALSKDARASQAAADKQPLTIDDIEAMRKGLATQRDVLYSEASGTSKSPQQAELFSQRADRVAQMGAARESTYGDAVNGYAADQRYIAGSKHGATGQPQEKATGSTRIDLQSPEGQLGYQSGLRTHINDLANKSESSAATLTKNLGQDTELPQNIANTFSQGAAFNERAAARGQALRNVQGIAPGTAQTEKGVNAAGNVTHALGAVALGPSNPWAYYHAVKAIPGLKMSDAVQHQVGKMLADPQQAQAALKAIAAAGASQNALRNIMQTVARSGGRFATGVTAGANQ